MWVKICANTNLEDALLAAQLGADAVGFVFAPSKRQVTVEQVAAITAKLPDNVSKVGVFTSTDAAEILSAAADAHLTTVQLHSDFNPALLEALDAGSNGALGVFQVLSIAEDTRPETFRAALTEALTHPYVLGVLLDASHGGASGGTGRPFNWDSVATIVREVQRETGGQIIVAGGLTPDNVADAIARFAPFGVDVASGVEAALGRKAPTRLQAFLTAAKS